MEPISGNALLQTLGSVGNTALGLIGWSKRLKASTQAQKELAEFQNQLSRENFDYEMSDKRNWNEYGEMLGKMRDTGINPLSFDGNTAGAGDASLGAASVPSVGNPSSPSFDLPDLLSAMLTKREQDIQKEKNDSDIELNEASTKKALQEVDNLIKEGLKTDKEREKFDAEISRIEAELKFRGQEILNSMFQLRLVSMRLNLDKQAFEWQKQYQSKQLGIDYLNAQVQRFNASTQRASYLHQVERDETELHISAQRAMSDIKSQGIDNYLKHLSTFEFKLPFGMSVPGALIKNILGPAVAIEQAIKRIPMSGSQKVESLKRLNALYDEADMLNIGIPDSLKGYGNYHFKNGLFKSPSWQP